METGNNKTATFIMVAVDLETPVSLGSVIHTGEITYDSHITLLAAKGRSIMREEVPLKKEWLEILKRNEDYEPLPVEDYFDLTIFSGQDNDWLVLKLKEETQLHKELTRINSDLRKALNVEEEFSTYNPHLSLAKLPKDHEGIDELKERLDLVLKASTVTLEDYILSECDMEDYKDFRKQNITPYNGVNRFFRERDLIRESESD